MLTYADSRERDQIYEYSGRRTPVYRGPLSNNRYLTSAGTVVTEDYASVAMFWAGMAGMFVEAKNMQ